MNLLELDRRACELNFELLEGLGEEELDMATPCAQWTVRELLQHQVDSTLSFTAWAQGLPADGLTRALGDDPLGTYKSVVQDVWAAFDAAGMLDRELEFPGYGRQSGRVLVASHFVDNLVHAWDLARALGRDHAFDEDLADAAVRITRNYPAGIAAFAPPVPVAEDAPATDRLVARLGRSPRWPA